ncbi:MAG: hypothetical protein COC09_05695 [Gammaproteobacteria bacterium]|nr:MAG: hypothetical protein COC09_05695 [Gammaproteobacteria bacterium]
MGKILTAINNQLDKAKDFRYFALLGSFVLFADALSILILNTALIDIGYKQLTQEINFGGILICFTLFAFFVSFFCATI